MATFFKSALELIRLQEIILNRDAEIKSLKQELQIVKNERTSVKNKESEVRADFISLEQSYDKIWEERKEDKKTIDELYSKNQLLENKLEHYIEQFHVYQVATEELKKQCEKMNKSRNYYKEFVRNVLSDED